MVGGRDTRKFGKKRYVLKWDSRFFNAPDTKAGMKEKRRVALLYVADYRNRGYLVRLTQSGKNFKVWILPR